MDTPLKVTAVLASPIAYGPPMLDATLEWLSAQMAESAERDDNSDSGGRAGWVSWREKVAPGASRHTGYVVPTISGPAPPMGVLPVPLATKKVGKWIIPLCSSPIMRTDAEDEERIVKRLSAWDAVRHTEAASMNVAAGPHKAAFKPVRTIYADQVVWFCVGHGFSKGNGKTRGPVAEMKRWAKRVAAIGANRQAGYGRVSEWIVEEWPEDRSWFAPHPDGGQVLMRPLPVDAVPDDLVGARPSHAGVCPPYWHRDRHAEVMMPC